jgi:hypothetical protein
MPDVSNAAAAKQLRRSSSFIALFIGSTASATRRRGFEALARSRSRKYPKRFGILPQLT